MLVKEIFEMYKDFQRLEVKKSTYQTMVPKIERHVIPYFGNVPVEDINLDAGRKWLHALLDKGLSVNFVNDIKIRFSSMMNFAIDHELIDRNPLTRLKKVKGSDTYQKIENFWNFEEFNKFITVVEDPLYNLLYYFLFYTGLRRGEVKALNWEDIDLTTGKISINKQMAKLQGNSRSITSPKSKASYRDLFIHKQLHNRLLPHYNSESVKNGFLLSDFVFGGKSPLSNTTMERKLNNYITQAKVKKITTHGFRHSHASFMIQSVGCDILTLAARLGHEDVKETLNTYSHLYQEKQKKIALDIEKYVADNQNNIEEFDKLLSNLYITVQDYSGKHILTGFHAAKIDSILGAIRY